MKDITREVIAEDYLGWIEIMTGPEMESWIESNNDSLWVKIYPGIYWIHPTQTKT